MSMYIGDSKFSNTPILSLVEGMSSQDMKNFEDILFGVSKGDNEVSVPNIAPFSQTIKFKFEAKNKIPDGMFGYDLADWTNYSGKWWRSPILDVVAGSTYCLSGESSLEQGLDKGYLYLTEAKPGFSDSSYIIRLFQGKNIHNNGFTFTPKEGYIYYFTFYADDGNTKDSATFKAYYKVMIEKGESITTYYAAPDVATSYRLAIQKPGANEYEFLTIGSLETLSTIKEVGYESDGSFSGLWCAIADNAPGIIITVEYAKYSPELYEQFYNELIAWNERNNQ